MKTKILLKESEMPTHWYNVIADMPNPPTPPLGPDGNPVGPDALAAIFPEELIKQEMSGERWIKIPDEVREVLRLWRPSPLYRAHRLEKMLNTPAKIFYKNESVSPAGSHKPNTAVAQAYYNKQAGIKKLTTETGAGQWGCSIALAGQMFGLDVEVFMVNISYGQKPYRRTMMRTWGAQVHASPTNLTESGRSILAKDPNSEGSLGIAISEAVEIAASRPDTNYALGSVLNHVLLHQTIIGEEAKKQLAMVGEYPDMIFAPCGGGSNFGGIAFPFFADKAAGKKIDLVAVEPTSCPTLTKGTYAYDFGDAIGLTPLMKMYTLGHDFMPPGIHAGGLRYHGDSALISQLYNEGLLSAIAVPQTETFEAGILFAKSEGIVPAPESTHAIAATIREARRCAETGEAKTLLFNLSGHGHFDMTSYDRYFAGELEDYDYPEEAIKESLAHLPKVG
ncbi:MAG: TrpB-like pyridoxal phosphate-dependent enzyme [Sedimenticola sp.]|uniref:Tryptophan synthase beta chain n=1 Tax=Sedimenticola thiotaurini TaxID=1543721 RepID=A0A558D0L2_9GAMM|nr:TrpB-like pyridoxal phosphate-dependent enzyme [Sedimenticola sp.]TVT54554.1 MAG: TrpB-like pyridoxal phosphate-dependent enzyme [Sedimenticola thiotaurini]MCW8920628.1 TrpB-like pyridoxal phosphate-dependent enzyme [Sedimenticola sp.]MCW8950245.1 TrpB-like pyridoxal phosphate-dependent enzyme [Sedimenticola sp.]MCW8974094.1 TrpB-like pyridoxal phosphate-dependent enzyme [Sedimenticola sp.]